MSHGCVHVEDVGQVVSHVYGQVVGHVCGMGLSHACGQVVMRVARV